MIIRRVSNSQLLITQPDHATLAARIMRQWVAGGLIDSPRRETILLAVEQHDNGWKEIDASPLLDAGGRVLDFIAAPDDVKRDVWPRGIDRLAATPYAAALVAEHALHIYHRNRNKHDWVSFFEQIETARERYLLAAGQGTLDELRKDYFFVRAGDLASLTFCNGWTDVQSDDSEPSFHLTGDRLVITPDPFDGGRVSMTIDARELPDQPFASAAEALGVFTNAPTVVVTGTASGSSANLAPR